MTDQTQSYKEFFLRVTKDFSPHPWQKELAGNPDCGNRLIRIPTGMGKTLGVLTTWLYHRIDQGNEEWPTRLVWCLPMRTLVDQTAREAKLLLESLGMEQHVDVHVLMGGVSEKRWYQSPEKPQILIGTQDMLLSRALNRGYAMGRAAWPRAFGLIHTDTLWVMDEVQLMDVGLTTSAQIQAFWEHYESLLGKPRVTWWMSATLQPEWLHSVETASMLPRLSDSMLTVRMEDRVGSQWAAKKPAERFVAAPKNWAQKVIETHSSHTADPQTGRQTLVVLNTVRKARDLFGELEKHYKSDEQKPDLRLVHSRFREADRESWADEFLSRSTLSPDTNRILVATQVVEAGVDISASCLFTELAPWPSLVQRFGRAARYGGNASVIVLDSEDNKKTQPYTPEQLTAAREAVEQISDVSIGSLEDYESKLSPEDLKKLYPFTPLHVLLNEEFNELFDTSIDLSGFDMDVSRFIRQADDSTDVHVFWRDWEGEPPSPELQPHRSELCRVSIRDAKDWLSKVAKRKEAVWKWDYLDGSWIKTKADDLSPSSVFLVAPQTGGYSKAKGFTGAPPSKKEPTESVPLQQKPALDDESKSDLADESEATSQVDTWKTIATHCWEAAQVADELCERNDIPANYKRLINLCLRLHDWGKAHPSFANGTYRCEPSRADLAKAPDKAWRKGNAIYNTLSHGPRRGFRHELASCLAVLELLRRIDPTHDALLGRYEVFLSELGEEPETQPEIHETNSVAAELQQLSEQDFNLLLYLIASHHGKVRMSLQASPKDQDFPLDNAQFQGEGMPIRGLRSGDELPPTLVTDADGNDALMPEITFGLSPATLGLSTRYGESWAERTLKLVKSINPFTLGYLEAIVRAADCRASDDSAAPGNLPDKRLVDQPLSIPEHEGTNEEASTKEELQHV